MAKQTWAKESPLVAQQTPVRKGNGDESDGHWNIRSLWDWEDTRSGDCVIASSETNIQELEDTSQHDIPNHLEQRVCARAQTARDTSGGRRLGTEMRAVDWASCSIVGSPFGGTVKLMNTKSEKQPCGRLWTVWQCAGDPPACHNDEVLRLLEVPRI